MSDRPATSRLAEIAALAVWVAAAGNVFVYMVQSFSQAWSALPLSTWQGQPGKKSTPATGAGSAAAAITVSNRRRKPGTSTPPATGTVPTGNRSVPTQTT